MTSDRSARVNNLLDAALELPSSERSLFLERECGEDAELCLEVESRLEAFDDYDGTSTFLEGPAVAPVTTSGEPTRVIAERGQDQGRRIGPYRLVRTIGRGGMGSVHLAERDDAQFRQRVALKVIRQGRKSREVLQRFLQERQILAALTHPNISRLLDGGATADGEPYFVMEYVEGLPLLSYCDRNCLDTEARLRLFLDVCAAVQYAHQNLVVHRDLKPSNVLVTTEGVVKLLDFGIARVLNPALTAATSVTRTGVRVMTPEYASPEQVRGEPVTTTSDVYSLGVILYEVLAGHGPFPFDSRQFYELSRFIVEGQPELPSTAVFRTRETRAAVEVAPFASRDDALTPEEVGRRRRTDPLSLRRRLRGDLDAIVLKAMRKEPELRYSSAARLAEDLAHHLAGRPVSAAGDSVRYRLSKFVRRNRFALLGTVTLLVASLLAGVLHTVRVTRERDRARTEASRAEAVTDFLVDLFEVSDPGVARGRELTARELLDHGAERLEGELKDQPQVQARLYDVVGSIYQRLGLYSRAAPFYDRAMELTSQVFGDDSPELARSAANKADLLVDVGEYEQAEALVRERLTKNRKFFGDKSLEVALSLDTLATVLQQSGRYHEARPLFEEALDVRRSVLGAEHVLVSTGLSNLALLYQDLGEYDLAEPLFRRSVEIDRKLLGSPHPELAISMGNLGMLLRRKFRAGDTPALEEAEPLVRQAYEMQRQVLGSSHSLVGNAANDYALVLMDRGQDDQAETLYREAIEIHRRALGEHAMVAVDLNNLASALAKRGSYAEAEALFRESLDINQRLLGKGHPDTAYQLQGLGSMFTLWHKPEAAIAAYDQALEIRRAALGGAHPITVSSVLALAGLLIENGQPERGDTLLRETRQLVAEGGGDRSTLEELDQALAKAPR